MNVSQDGEKIGKLKEDLNLALEELEKGKTTVNRLLELLLDVAETRHQREKIALFLVEVRREDRDQTRSILDNLLEAYRESGYEGIIRFMRDWEFHNSKPNGSELS